MAEGSALESTKSTAHPDKNKELLTFSSLKYFLVMLSFGKANLNVHIRIPEAMENHVRMKCEEPS